MASYDSPEAPRQPRNSKIDTDLQELENMESDLKNIAEKMIHSRRNLSDQLKNKFCSILSVQRPVLPLLGSGPEPEPGPSGGVDSDAGVHVESDKGSLIAEEDRETSKKTNLLKQKISNNISAMPITLNRMNECMSRFDKHDSYNRIIHPAFKKKRTIY